MGRGEEPATVRHPGSELRLGGRENRRTKIINGMVGKKKKKKKKKKKLLPKPEKPN